VAADDSLPVELTIEVRAGEGAPAGTLTHAERIVLVDQAVVLLEDEHVHLPLTSAMHAVPLLPEASGHGAGASPRVRRPRLG
jgi:hypothetical protein